MGMFIDFASLGFSLFPSKHPSTEWWQRKNMWPWNTYLPLKEYKTAEHVIWNSFRIISDELIGGHSQVCRYRGKKEVQGQAEIP